MKFEEIEKLLVNAIDQVEMYFPDALGAEKQMLATAYILGVVEKVDNLVPTIGAFMDLPIADMAERYVITAAVEWVFARLRVEQAKLEAKVK